MRRLMKAVNVEKPRTQSTKLSKCLFGKGVLNDSVRFSRFLPLWRTRSAIKWETESFWAGLFQPLALEAVGTIFVAFLLSPAGMDFRKSNWEYFWYLYKNRCQRAQLLDNYA
jgi:hypothetical protein